jgi:NADPH-dependent 2,4-dienoyl-CoA reductase/sulfur reductase-like enzyme
MFGSTCHAPPCSGQQGHPPDWTNREGGESDLVVLGGGPAGLVAAITAATGGHRVAMTELAAGVQGSTALRRPLSAGALTRTYPPLPNITGILVDPAH